MTASPARGRPAEWPPSKLDEQPACRRPLASCKAGREVVERIVSRVLSLSWLPFSGGDHSSVRHYPGSGTGSPSAGP
jgi:hypothetical protein